MSFRRFWLVKLDTDTVSFRSKSEAQAFAEKLQARLDAPHGLPASNQYQVRNALPQRLLDELIAEEMPVLPVYLMSSVKMRESHQACKPLI